MPHSEQNPGQARTAAAWPVSQGRGIVLAPLWPLEVWIPGKVEAQRRGSSHWRHEYTYRRRWKVATWSTVTRALWRRSVDPATPKRITLHAVVGGRFDSTDNLRWALKAVVDALKVPQARRVKGIRREGIGAGVIQDDRDRDGHDFQYGQTVTRDRGRWGVHLRVELR